METRTFSVKGMTCSHCVMAVAKALKGVSGVSDARVDLDKGQATVTFDPATASTSKMKEAVEDAGYELAV
ncbi:MAG: copper ion binding protein [Bacillota bacterium]